MCILLAPAASVSYIEHTITVNYGNSKKLATIVIFFGMIVS